MTAWRLFSTEILWEGCNWKERSTRAINMTYLLSHMLLMTLNEISEQKKSYDVWCQHNKIRLFPLQGQS